MNNSFSQDSIKTYTDGSRRGEGRGSEARGGEEERVEEVRREEGMRELATPHSNGTFQNSQTYVHIYTFSGFLVTILKSKQLYVCFWNPT